MKPTIVTLSGAQGGTTSVQFQEIFGEYSEARGRGRARRQARRMERIANKQERKVAKQQMRSAKRQARIAKRADAQQARQQKRTTKVQMAQDRRMQRKQGRVQRKALGKEEEGLEEDGMENQVEEQEEPLNQEGDSTQDNQGSGEGEYETTQDGDVGDGEQVEQEVDGEQDQSDEESGFTGDIGIDGVVTMSEEDKVWNEYFSSASGNEKINPHVKRLSRRIEITKHKIKRAEESGEKDQTKINRLKAQLANMVNKLAGYSKFDGDFSEARGGKSQVAKRKAEVRAAKKEARIERKAVAKQIAQEKRAARQVSRPMRRRSVTAVEQGMDAQMKQDEIVVPAEENFNNSVNSANSDEVASSATGLIGIDEINDIDAPEVRKFDLNFSNASGDTKPKIDVKNIAIGVGVGVLAIYLIKKFAK